MSLLRCVADNIARPAPKVFSTTAVVGPLEQPWREAEAELASEPLSGFVAVATSGRAKRPRTSNCLMTLSNIRAFGWRDLWEQARSDGKDQQSTQ